MKRVSKFKFAYQVWLIIIDTTVTTTALLAMQLLKWSSRGPNQLRQNLMFSQAVLNAISEGLFGINQHGEIVFENQAASRMLGWDSEGLQGHFVETITQPASSVTVKQLTNNCGLFATLLDGESRHVINEYFWRKDGSYFPVEYTCTVIHDEKQAIIGIIVSFRDITELKIAEAELQAAKYARNLIEASLDPLFTINANGKITDVNLAAERAIGLGRDRLINSDFAQYFLQTALAEQAYQNAFVQGNVSDYPLTLRHFSGKLTEILYNAAVYHDNSGKVAGVLTTLRDITERKLAEQQLRIAATAFESLQGIIITDTQQLILRVNKAFAEISGYAAAELMGKPVAVLYSKNADTRFYQSIWNRVAETGCWEGEVNNIRKNGEPYIEYLVIQAIKDDNHETTYFVITSNDITQKKAAAVEIERLAFFDPLTNIPNRRLLQDRLKPALAYSQRSGEKGALFFIDLDNFKTLNDTLGHDMGDLLLQQVAERLQNCIRECDTVARLGGDEFVIMITNLSDQLVVAVNETEIIGNKVLAIFNKPFVLVNQEFICTASIGVTLFSTVGQTVEALLKQADVAMYQSKKAGRNKLSFFDPDMQSMVDTRFNLESGLREALVSEQFQLHYQLQLNKALQPIGAEVLIRWRQPGQPLLMPKDFIGLAEETGLILPIGLWVIDSVCAQLKEWQQDVSTQELVLSVNVSAKQFFQSQFVKQILSTMQRHFINPALLKIEITESMLVENIDVTIRTMQQLGEHGISFSLQDYGTGYSSLQFLKKLPLDELKIDQSFIRDFAENSGDLAIISTIIAMARAMNLSVIAEGVETQQQQQLLHDMGEINYQGYLFSKPVPIAEFESDLKARVTHFNSNVLH